MRENIKQPWDQTQNQSGPYGPSRAWGLQRKREGPSATEIREAPQEEPVSGSLRKKELLMWEGQSLAPLRVSPSPGPCFPFLPPYSSTAPVANQIATRQNVLLCREWGLFQWTAPSSPFLPSLVHHALQLGPLTPTLACVLQGIRK